MQVKRDLLLFMSGGIFCSLYFLIDEQLAVKIQSFEYLPRKSSTTIKEKETPLDRRQCLIQHNSSISSDDFKEQELFLKTDKAKSYKKILAIRWFYGRYGIGHGYKPFEEACCEEKRCFITSKNILPTTEYDAILFQSEMITCSHVPKHRSRHQRWIYYAKEPSLIGNKALKKLSSLQFNWTMTFRRDSDVLARYGHIIKKDSFPLSRSIDQQKLKLLEFHLKSKTKPVAWLVSHCRTFSKREDYVRLLEKKIKVDIFGDCGPLKCSQNNRTQCYEMLEGDYKFYLSFENSFCKDYITEKFFNIMKYNIVPVVRGFGDYKSIAPPHSYIDTRDFAKPKDLANYLLYLDNNDTAYAEYFKWKKDYVVLSHFEDWLSRGLNFCSLCKKLHEDTTRKTYYNFKKWLIDDSKCVGLKQKVKH